MYLNGKCCTEKENPYKQTKKTNDKLGKNMCKLYYRKEVHIPKIQNTEQKWARNMV